MSVNRKVLDFDFERICSVTLSTVNVYVCLACGKYLQGRGEGTPAYMHALHHEEHRLYMSLSTLKFYSLPDNLKFPDPNGELNDIRAVLTPTFNPQILSQIDANAQLFQDLHGKLYLPGYCGLNNVKANDYVNVVVQVLAHIVPLRDSFLLNSKSGEVTAAWIELLRKLWNPNRFKAQNSPHEFLQTINQVSAKRFSLTAQADPGDFLTWFLNALEADNPGCLNEFLRSSVRIESVKLDRDGAVSSSSAEEKSFLHLSLDLPPKPLFSDPKAPAAVPQVSLAALLTKFDGGTPVFKQSSAFTYKLTRLPQFLLLYVTRRVKGRFGIEWNDTLVRFNADELIELPSYSNVKYRLMANIYCRRSESEKDKKSFGVHLRHRASGKWLEMENLQVKETESQLLFMAESLIQLWERAY